MNYYVFIFDFSLVALLLSVAILLVWCWIGFMDQRESHPVYLQSMPAQNKALLVKVEERHSA